MLLFVIIYNVLAIEQGVFDAFPKRWLFDVDVNVYVIGGFAEKQDAVAQYNR